MSKHAAMSRRAFIGVTLGVASGALVTACGGAAPPAAPTAKPAEATKPTETAKPAVAAKPTEVAKPAEATSSAQSSAVATSAPKPAPQAASAPKVAIKGNLTVVMARDLHPDQNTFVEQKIREFADRQGYPLDHAYTERYAGTGNVVQKLTAAVQAGDAPDVILHTLQPSELKFLEIIEDVDDLQKEIIGQFGKAVPSMERRAFLDGKWWAIQYFLRSGSYWALEAPFKSAGVDLDTAMGDWGSVREACLKASSPEKELWGWGMTGNRSSDGEGLIVAAVFMWGGQLVDETGQLVVLDKEPYRQHAIAGLEWLKETYTDPRWAPMLPPGVGAWTDPSNNEAYLAGKIGFTANSGTLYAKAILDKNPVADDSRLVPRPKGLGPAGRSLEGTDGFRWFIMKGAKNREAAEQLIRYMTSAEVQTEMMQFSPGYVYPSYEWGWDDKILTENKYAAKVTPSFQKVAWDPSGFTGSSWPGPPTPWAAAMESTNFWTDLFGEILGGKPVPDAVRDGHARAVRVFKEFGAKGE